MNQEPTQRLDEIERVYVQRDEYPPAVDDIAWLLAIARAALVIDGDLHKGGVDVIYRWGSDKTNPHELELHRDALHETLHGRSEGGVK